MMAKKSADAVAKSCVLLNSPDSDARWADLAFPMVVALDSGLADRPRQASVLTPAGEPTSLRATWSPRGDSSVVHLRRIGYSGSMTMLPPDPSWHHDAIIYQLHVKAFRDSNRDGFGDFRGLLEKLDYIAELGVTAIWLLPFYPSPLKDDGYDIADFTGVHPNY